MEESSCEKTGHLIRTTRTDRGSGDEFDSCEICGCAVVKGSWNTPWRQPGYARELFRKIDEAAKLKEKAHEPQ